MRERRAPDEVLYAFSQWLQQWADYALSQAQGFASPAAPDEEKPASGDPPAPASSQPPKHWLEQIPTGPPAHWLALFEEYGLKPPEADPAPGAVTVGNRTLESGPRPLQDWLDEFQRGLDQFTQPPAPLSPDLGEPERATQSLSPSVPDEAAAAESPLPATAKHRRVPEYQETGDEEQPAAPTAPSLQSFSPTWISPGEDPAEGSALSPPSRETASPKRQPLPISSLQTRDGVEPTAPASSPDRPVNLRPKPLLQRETPLASDLAGFDEADESPPAPVSFSRLTVASSSKESHKEDSQVTDSVAGARVDPRPIAASAPQLEREEARTVPVRLHLNPRVPVPAPAPLPTVEGRIEPADIQPSQAVPYPAPRLIVRAQTSAVQPPSTPAAAIVAPAGGFSNGEPDIPSKTFAAADNPQPWAESEKEDLAPGMDLAAILSAIRRREDSHPFIPHSQARTVQPSPKWSPPPAVHWPELPERLPTVRPPSNVLANPSHRMRINREQRGRSWNT